MEPKKILIIDDNMSNRMLLRKMLGEEYAILEAENGIVGLALLEKLHDKLSLVILDIWMPQIDGIGVLAQMRAHGWLRELPVVIVTSDATGELEARLMNYGVQYVILKPFDPHMVTDCVHEAIKGKKNTAGGLVFFNENDSQQSLLTRVNSFLFEFNHTSGASRIDARYKKYLRGNWHLFRINTPETVRDSIYRPDYPLFTEFLQRDGTEEYETIDLRLLASSGCYEWYRIGRLRYADEYGVHTLLTFANVSDEMRARERLEFLARHDPLTMIPNFAAFADSTRKMLDAHPDGAFVMLRIGIERFSILNQIYGRGEGDKLLRFVAVKLQETVEACGRGTYCRAASDDFAACFSPDDSSIEEVVAEMQQTLCAYPINFEIVLNFGIFPIDDRRMSVEDLFERATTAQKTVRGRYNHHVACYDAALRERDETERMILRDMQDALRERQFVMYLQPKCDMRDGHIIGSEALVRWMHPKRGMISPGAFVPLFEKNGFIAAIDGFVFEEACRTLRRWLDEGVPALPVSVNISRADLYNPHLLEDILQVVGRYRIPHELLGFELTESSFVIDNNMVCELTEQLKENGFCVLMDDFGSGYSSLNTLKDIRVNVLKIDLRFLQSADDVARSNCILRWVCGMVHEIGMNIVVEGVETKEQADYLQSIGVRFAQGFRYYRPMPVMDYEAALRNEKQPAI